MNSQRNKVFDELKSKHLKQTIGSANNSLPTTSSSSPSPFILSSGPVTGSNMPVSILPNQLTPPISGQSSFSTLEPMTPSQKAVAQAHQLSYGFYIPQDSNYNPILPVLPRFN
uniref:Uncharacterized protein LOC113791197 n=1 Tax=Dermatophagoides pteronyssinus TaxID=6956 RepID=A0A6P6XUW6_DERPT|nr:uncharacterized protein LOC113791197 [Dermatophagoides pteronyssinus]